MRHRSVEGATIGPDRMILDSVYIIYGKERASFVSLGASSAEDLAIEQDYNTVMVQINAFRSGIVRIPKRVVSTSKWKGKKSKRTQ